ncbi:hypothetical protein V4D30_01555 [Thermodesulfovibrio sp. 3907-1M]|uniref:Uncharacterized protein n=1 Tax=Thermodesulfovibrio autotrophicus TaxID=3118333 RepID=A0AAU8GWR4_9BACT
MKYLRRICFCRGSDYYRADGKNPSLYSRLMPMNSDRFLTENSMARHKTLDKCHLEDKLTEIIKEKIYKKGG